MKRFLLVCLGLGFGMNCAPQGHSGNGSPSLDPIMPDRPDAVTVGETTSGTADAISKEERNPAPEDETAIIDDASESTCRVSSITDAKWWDDAVAYEIFVRSFQDSNGDGTGDLAGLKDRLNYLKSANGENSLGIDLIWLMPILESPSYHGYDVVNYDAVDQEYGTLESLESLLETAKKQEIRVVMDYVMNHSSDNHPWFVKSAQEVDGPFRDYYTWNTDDLGWTQPWGSSGTWHQKVGAFYYGLFSPSMPDLNFQNPAVEESITNSAAKWIESGLDGFRLDAVRYLIENGGGAGQKDQQQTHEAWARFRERMDSAGDVPLLVGEAWAEMDIAKSYFGTKNKPEMNMVFDFDGATAMLQSVASQSSNAVRQSWCKRWKNTDHHGSWGTFLSNHDQDRVATTLKKHGVRALRTAAALLLLSPGTPWIYYGEEIGAENGESWGDMGRREPMFWSDGENGFTSAGEPWTGVSKKGEYSSVESQWNEPTSLLRWYQSLITARNNNIALRRGSAEFIDIEPDAVALHRAHEEQECLILVPLTEAKAMYTLRHPDISGKWDAILNGVSLDIADDILELEGQPGMAHVLCRPGTSLGE